MTSLVRYPRSAQRTAQRDAHSVSTVPSIPQAQLFPRLAAVNGYAPGTLATTSPAGQTIANPVWALFYWRYGLHTIQATTGPQGVSAIKKLNPGVKLLVYVNVVDATTGSMWDATNGVWRYKATTTALPGWHVNPQWWMGNVGSTISTIGALSGTGTGTFQIANTTGLTTGTAIDVQVITPNASPSARQSNPTAETMNVTIAAGTPATVTINTRGTYGSTPVAHAVGDLVRLHAQWYTNTRYLYNLTPLCPTDANGRTIMDELSDYVQVLVGWLGCDGVFLDNNIPMLWNAGSGQNLGTKAVNVDANNDNAGDSAEGLATATTTTWWHDGLQTLSQLIRMKLPSAYIINNDFHFTPWSSGREMESFNGISGNEAASGGQTTLTGTNFSRTFFGLLPYVQHLSDPAAGLAGFCPTILNADNNNTTPTAFNATVTLYQQNRCNLGIACLTNAYLAFDGGPSGTYGHGTVWWFDEYDAGAGSSLASAITSTATSIPLATGTGSRFKAGDIVHVPNAAADTGDEMMLVNSVSGDTLTVAARPYMGSNTAQVAGTKVLTEGQMRAGIGWLGLPLGLAKQVGATTALTGTLPANAAMTGSAGTTGGTFTGTVPTSWACNGSSGATATCAVETTDLPPGATSAVKLTASAAVLNNTFALEFYQQMATGQGFPTAGNASAAVTYTATFWAKASMDGVLVAFDITNAVSATQNFRLTTDWRQYSMTFTLASGVATTSYLYRCEIDYLAGTWIELALPTLAVGDANQYYRLFQSGVVLLNMGATSASFSAPDSRSYWHIKGTQDATNNTGASVTWPVTVAAQDALFLRTTAP